MFERILDILGCGQGEDEEMEIPLTGGWHPRYSKNVSYEAKGNLTVPRKGMGQIHYFMHGAMKGARYNGVLHVRFKVSTDIDTKFYQDGTEVNNPTFRPMLQVKNDSLTTSNGRFWSNPQRVNLKGHGGTYSMAITLNEEHWSGVFGKRSSSGLRSLLKNLGSVGITFGGGGNFGHGLSCDGQCKVTILEYKFS